MKRWVSVLGATLLILVFVLYLRQARSLEATLDEAHAGAAIWAITPIPEGSLVWYEHAGYPFVAWASQTALGWEVHRTRSIPAPEPGSPVTWAVSNPEKAFGLFLARASAEVTQLQVNGQSAQQVDGSGVWWIYFDDPLNPPVDIKAYDVDHRVIYQYPGTLQTAEMPSPIRAFLVSSPETERRYTWDASQGLSLPGPLRLRVEVADQSQAAVIEWYFEGILSPTTGLVPLGPVRQVPLGTGEHLPPCLPCARTSGHRCCGPGPDHRRPGDEPTDHRSNGPALPHPAQRRP